VSSISVMAEIDRLAWDTIPDEEIVTRVRAGDTALYEILMRRHNQRLYRIGRSILRDDAEAEDVIQEAYVRAYEHLGDFMGEAKFSTWLTRIAIHEALGRIRKRSRTSDLESVTNGDLHLTSVGVAPTDNPEGLAYDRELKIVLEKAIDKLPQEYRTVVVLRIVEELSINETAECLDLTIETVKTRLHRGRALLQKYLRRRAGIVAPQIFPFHFSRCDRIVENVLRRIRANSEQVLL
jgi:RNA polymerase sigma-70 factor (ECF subfamily)